MAVYSRTLTRKRYFNVFIIYGATPLILIGQLLAISSSPIVARPRETRQAVAFNIGETAARPNAEPNGSDVPALPFVQLSESASGFALTGNNQPFRPWGFNYDHDERGRLLEDYWEAEWAKVEEDFAEMKALGANCVRIHLQFGRFMDGPDRPNPRALNQLRRLLSLAERQHLYLDLTGLGCYHKKDVPAWYDALNEADRWQAQAHFWIAIARQAAHSPAVFCYDLMNEPVVPGGKRQSGEWLPPPFGDKHFVQFITLDQGQRTRPDIARAWIRQLVQAIRRVDRRHLITVGLVDWSLDRPGLTSGFVPQRIVSELDFLAVHIYPHKNKLNEALKTLQGFAVGKPVVVEESFPLWCTAEELEQFVTQADKQAAGWFFFYWGRTLQQLAQDKDLGAALQRAWLERFHRLSARYDVSSSSSNR
jgi:hypothetical protein